MDKITRQNHFWRLSLFFLGNILIIRDTHTQWNETASKQNVLTNNYSVLEWFNRIQRSIFIIYRMIMYQDRVIMNQDSFQWVCKSYLFYIKPQTTVLEKASSSPFKVFPKGLFPSYLEHQSESWSMVNKCVE